MNKTVKFSTLILVLLFIACQPDDQRPNVIVILADDMGYSDIGCYGGEIPTPNIDALGENGIRFSQFYNGFFAAYLL